MTSSTLKTSSSRNDSLPSAFRRYRSQIDGAMRTGLANDDGVHVYDMLRYSMGWVDVDGNPVVATQGKALRPTLCLLACEATGGSLDRAMPAAVALEFIHCFSLIHDDIQDGDETRRHRSTLWAVWGVPKAIEAGNILRVVADRSLSELVDGGVSFDDALTVTSLLTQGYLQMIEGQYLDIAYESRPDIGMSQYLDMISRKTGALIRGAMHIGAIIGSSDPRVVAAFEDCGRSLGFLFQIKDDVLGVWGDEEATGKPVGADIRRKKNSLPVVYAMSMVSGADKETLSEIYGREEVSGQDVTEVLGILDRVGAREYAEELAGMRRDEALEALASVELAPRSSDDLAGLSQFLLERQY